MNVKLKNYIKKQLKNETHTLSADIKELFITYLLNLRYSILFLTPQRKKLKKTKRLKNTKKGKSCFVFANGPSINLLDFKKIKKYQEKGFDVFCVNSYINSQQAKIVTPNYYTLSDPAHFGIYQKSTTPQTKEKVISDVKILNKLNIPVFIPAQYSKFNVLNNHYLFNDSENRFSKNINPLKPRGYLSMTAYKALAIACYMGYDKIYICGFDNDYFKSFEIDENNEIYYKNNHYYDKEIRRMTPGDGKCIGNLLWEHAQLFKNMELFSKNNIFNLNKDGLIDTFSKKHKLNIYKITQK